MHKRQSVKVYFFWKSRILDNIVLNEINPIIDNRDIMTFLIKIFITSIFSLVLFAKNTAAEILTVKSVLFRKLYRTKITALFFEIVRQILY